MMSEKEMLLARACIARMEHATALMNLTIAQANRDTQLGEWRVNYAAQVEAFRCAYDNAHFELKEILRLADTTS